MKSQQISAVDLYERKRVPIHDSNMSYVDEGQGSPIVLLHGNPTSSYLWRNVIPHLAEKNRCLAPDLIGMGASGPSRSGTYRFDDHARYLESWIESLGIDEKIVLVGHDWGSALMFDWASRHSSQIKGLVYMEAIVRPLTWDEWPEDARGIFEGMRSDAGDDLILNRNVFVERILPASIIRPLSPEEMDAYRGPYMQPGASRMPTLTWPREIPLDGEPTDMAALVDSYARWLTKTDIPKLFINAVPGSILTGAQREFCRTWSNQIEVSVSGLHFIQEDSPHEIGQAIRTWLDSGVFHSS